VVSARVNLLTKTEQFDDAVWVKTATTITSNAAVAPDGTLTADKLVEDTANSLHNVQGGPTVISGVAYTGSVYLKAAERTSVTVRTGGGGLPDSGAIINLSSGVISSQFGSPTSVSISSAGNGWYQVSIVNTSASSTTGRIYVALNASTPASPNGQTYTGDGTSGVYLWGADLRASNQGVGLPVYQRVNTSTDYDSTGFPVYIKPNGSNQFMQTNSINFTATDKMTVWQGVRKLSDASTALPIELSVNAASNNGAFFVAAPVSVNSNYQFSTSGTARAQSSYTNASIAAPVTNVLTSIGDISGDVATLRVNAVQVNTSSSDQGTGNYGTYPAYFYSRAGTGFFFNGNDYGSIARGAASTAAQIAAGEEWINSKTKAY
jgi:hypothetical protein